VAAVTILFASWRERTRCSIPRDATWHTGGGGDDWMIVTGSVYGGPGEDQLEPFGVAKAVGGPGADVIYAHNDERNTVSCGTGRDTVYFDGTLDSLAADCERQIPRQYEPPINAPFDTP
jgi:hypothetical protein